MKIKPFLQITYALAGLCISLFTAIMTYLIIDEPIGLKMISQITLTILSTLPIITIFSYYIGKYLSRKFELISLRLDEIDKNKFLNTEHNDKIKEINSIHTSINNLSSRLESTVLELQENNKNLNNIIKSISHDIKTPLTIIDGYLEELEDNIISKNNIPHIIDILKKETAYLNELTSETINYIQALEPLHTSKDTILLKEFLSLEVCPLIRVHSGVTLKCEIDEELTIEFNSLSLKKIIVNLLYNASKHTKKGTIIIKVIKENIVVEDTGMGINSKYSQTIFEPFISLDESRNREKNGFGLGLSIASSLAKNNSYTLVLDTNYRNGCKFILQK